MGRTKKKHVDTDEVVTESMSIHIHQDYPDHVWGS